MAKYTYEQLKSNYGDFHHPVIVLKINGEDFAHKDQQFVVSDIEVELTCGFEASIASFTLYDTFDMDSSSFMIKDVTKYISLGLPVEIALGYEHKAQVVFCGYIARVNFQYEAGNMPGIRVTAMDVKGIMMANRYSKRIKAKSYSDAVNEIFKEAPYKKLQSNAGTTGDGKIIKKLVISQTPDGSAAETAGADKATDRTIEMVAESDYEFVVKAAKRYNFEFFTECGNVYFRPAKSNSDVLIEMGPGKGLWYFDVEYDITGLVRNVETRSTDVGKGELIFAQKSIKNKVSTASGADALLNKSKKVYLDPSIHSKKEAEYRANSLVEEISYRLGSLECSCIGLPELLPGAFFVLKGMGEPPENKFYISRIVHKMNQDEGFVTKLYGKASEIKQ